jgi:hypothetical protein
LVTQRWDIRVGTSQGPRTLITLKCLDTSILNTDENHLITLTITYIAQHHHDAFLSRTRTKWHPCGRDDQHSLSLLLNCLGRASSGKIRSKRRFRHNKQRRQNIDTFFDSIQRRLFEALNFAFFHSVIYYGKSPLF